MKKAYLNEIEYYLPKETLDNAKLNSLFPEWSADKISRKTGIYDRHIAAKGECTSDMACSAAEKLFKLNGVDRASIDFVLLCTQSPDYFLPTTACIVQDRLGLENSCGALDFNLGCSGFVYGLGIAKGLIATEQASNILLITSESYSKYINDKDKSNRTIFGDGAAASLVSNKKHGIGGEILNFTHGTDGSGAKSLIVRNGGMKNPFNNSEEKIDEYGNVTSDNNLYMDGREVFNFTIDCVPKLVEDVLDKNKLTKEDIDKFVFHQANKFMLNHLRKKIKINEDKFIISLKNSGNTVSSTIPIALKNSFLSDTIKSDEKVLLAGFGVGLSWSGVVLQY